MLNLRPVSLRNLFSVFFFFFFHVEMPQASTDGLHFRDLIFKVRSILLVSRVIRRLTNDFWSYNLVET